MEIFIEEDILMVSLLDLDNTIGKMEVTLKENSKMVFETVKVYGREVLETVINMKGIMKMIRNRVMESSHGVQGMFIKETMIVMFVMVTVKCIGMTGVIIREAGKVEFSMVKVVILFI